MLNVAAATREIDDLLDRGASFRRLGGGFAFTEGPVWDAATASLLFGDIRFDGRYRWSEANGVELLARPNFIGNGMVFDHAGDLLVCEHVTSCVVRIRRNGDRHIVAYHYGGRYLNIPEPCVGAGPAVTRWPGLPRPSARAACTPRCGGSR
ncbi:hypothetical protein GCM10022251_68740 [Phytohabitans flavus]|uniref:SMP-30/Gluconolactonase/LRE-like region domain-containing protein n=2 Tax=Phytohabitans flavus TaxID=1076124 RepID=A0A6F8XQU0_9ACTN|nr:hypothetical protein Pflav_026140 [Phytohabitans flavus]